MDGKAYAALLRNIADWYEAHPDMPFTTTISVGEVTETRDAAAALARALAPCRKEHTTDFFTLTREFGGVDLRFVFYRATACERVVVGTEDIPEQIEPAYTREKIEWRCAPIFQEG